MRVVGVQPIQDSRQHGFPFDQGFSISESENLKTKLIHHLRASRISGHRFGFEVLAAIQFDDELRFEACEISEVPSHWMLAPKLETAQLPIAQGLPKKALRIGRSLTQRPRPHPSPLPQAGEGARGDSLRGHG